MIATAQEPTIKRGVQSVEAYNTRPYRVIFQCGHYVVLHALDKSAAVERAKQRYPEKVVERAEYVV